MFKIVIVLVCISFYALSLNSQTTVRYLKSKNSSKEVDIKKALFSEIKTVSSNGEIKKDVMNLSTNQIVKSETFKSNEPYGIWIYEEDNLFRELDYNFEIKYGKSECKDTFPKSINPVDFFNDNDSLNYVAPKFSNKETSIYHYIGKNIHYPEMAIEEGVRGVVYVSFNITNNGDVEGVSIIKGVDILLDKEAMRVIRKLKFLNPPLLNGKPQNICFLLPLSFKLN